MQHNSFKKDTYENTGIALDGAPVASAMKNGQVKWKICSEEVVVIVAHEASISVRPPMVGPRAVRNLMAKNRHGTCCAAREKNA